MRRDFANIARGIRRRLRGSGIVEGASGGGYDNECLLLYLVEPFRESDRRYDHQNQWQVRELAEIVSGFGYNVDVIHFNDRKVRLRKRYDMVIDLHPGLNDAYYRNMAVDCTRVGYITGTNPSVANRAEQRRIQGVWDRRGVRLRERRQAKPFAREDLEALDAMFLIGNRNTLVSYQEFHLKNVFLLNNTGYDFLRNEDLSAKSPRNFLFLGGYGQVHKGLDLLLEVFSKNRHWNLFVCSAYHLEKDFCKAYEKELFRTGNIFPLGLMDICSEDFRKICRECSYCVLPSCAEGMSGSVLTCMSAGLVPIVSRECGMEDSEAHHFLDCSIGCIEATLGSFAERGRDWIAEESRRVMDLVRAKYSMENYAETIRGAMKELLT